MEDVATLATNVINQRKEVIRCLMVQQWGRFSSFGGRASKGRRARAGGILLQSTREAQRSKRHAWSPGLELSGR
jgi:hypothetical protein